jgi:hypothetical protein
MKINEICFEAENDDGTKVKVKRVSTGNESIKNRCDGCFFEKDKDKDSYGRCPIIETGMKICITGYIFKEIINEKV